MTIDPSTLREIVTMVLAGGRGERLYPLTRDRSKPAVPFGGTYRIIDFTLSNCINSGLRRIYVLPQYKSQSLTRHLRDGWNILSSELGEHVSALPPQLRVGSHWYLGTADAIFQNIYTLAEDRPRLVLVLSGDHVYRMDYRPMIAAHLARGADVTLAVLPVPAREASRFGVVETAGDGCVVRFREKPDDLDPDGPDVVANMGVYLFTTDVLVEALSRDARAADSRHDFGHDVLPGLVEAGRTVQAWTFRSDEPDRRPYWRDIGTLDAYYEANMDLISVSPQFNLYDRTRPVRSARVLAPPAKFVFSGGDEGDRIGEAHDSLVSPGAIVSGGRVTRSVIGPWCRVNSWAEVSDSILMDEVVVGRRAVIRRAIVDKGVVIPPGFRLGVDPEQDRRRFIVTEGGVTVVPRHEQL